MNVLVLDNFNTPELKKILKGENYNYTPVYYAAGVFIELEKKKFDFFVSDISLGGAIYDDFLSKIREKYPDLFIILTSTIGDEEKVLGAMQNKLYDLMVIPFNIPELLLALNSLRDKKFPKQRKIAELPQKKVREWPENIIGYSQKMKEIFEFIINVSDKDISILVNGESGTGKEVIASTIHKMSNRSTRPFIKVNCAAIPETLIESELFGHEKGSFTGAFERRIGKFELAHSGTIFLDEIGDMSLTTQAKLLRVIENREFERIGGIKTIKVDIRIIAATNHDLKKDVMEKKFREDLYYRINVANIKLPPLRDRKDEILHLSDFFLKKFNEKFNKSIISFSSDVLSIFMSYDWPGNIRELKNVVETAVALENSNIIQLSALPQFIETDIDRNRKDNLNVNIDPVAILVNSGKSLKEIEKMVLRYALEVSGGNKIKAGRLLGLGKGATQYKFNKL